MALGQNGGGGLGHLVTTTATTFVLFIQTEAGATPMLTVVVTCASALTSKDLLNNRNKFKIGCQEKVPDILYFIFIGPLILYSNIKLK